MDDFVTRVCLVSAMRLRAEYHGHRRRNERNKKDCAYFPEGTAWVDGAPSDHWMTGFGVEGMHAMAQGRSLGELFAILDAVYDQGGYNCGWGKVHF